MLTTAYKVASGVMKRFCNEIPVMALQLCDCTKNPLNCTVEMGEFDGMWIVSQ